MPPIAPTQIVACSADRAAEDPAEHRPDRDRAPDDEAHRRVHPALHPLGVIAWRRLTWLML